MRVLLVEDEGPLADTIARSLRARGYQTTVAPTGESAMAELTRARPDVVVLDVNLPDLTGWDILRRLSESDQPRPGVVVISAGPISQKRIEELRPDKWLEKPFPLDALIRALQELELSPSDGQEDGGRT
ncbi:MAG: response regulator [Dehalococcoidia bacterium]